MWFSEKALVFVDTRSAAVAVYQKAWGRPRLLRFAFERFDSRSSQEALFKDVLVDSADALARLVRETRAGGCEVTALLPLGAAFPSIVDLAGLKGRGVQVDEAEAVRFRLAPLLPFPMAEAEVRSDATSWIGPGVVLAQAIPRTAVLETGKLMESLGFKRPRVTSALSAALRGLPPRPRMVDLILGDSACALAVRSEGGAVEAIHLRLLLEGDDRAHRSLDEARRATSDSREIRVLGEDTTALRDWPGQSTLQPAFDEPSLRGGPDPQRFPFLAVFHADGVR